MIVFILFGLILIYIGRKCREVGQRRRVGYFLGYCENSSIIINIREVKVILFATSVAK